MHLVIAQLPQLTQKNKGAPEDVSHLCNWWPSVSPLHSSFLKGFGLPLHPSIGNEETCAAGGMATRQCSPLQSPSNRFHECQPTLILLRLLSCFWPGSRSKECFGKMGKTAAAAVAIPRARIRFSLSCLTRAWGASGCKPRACLACSST